MIRHQKGFGSIGLYASIGVGVLIVLLIAAVLYFKSQSEANYQKYERVNTTFAIFKKHTEVANEAYEEAYALASGRALDSKNKWGDWYAKQVINISKRVVDLERMLDERNKSRSNQRQIPKEPDWFSGVECRKPRSETVGDLSGYRARTLGACEELISSLQKGDNHKSHRVLRELAEPFAKQTKELKAIKGSSRDIDLIEGN